MKKHLLLLLSVLCSQWVIGQIGTWRTYMAYHDIQQIQAAGSELFVLASNDLYQYNLQDQSITTYDRLNGLSDTYITHIKWCQQARRLVAVYGNSNIDLIETNGNVTNISDIYSKTIAGDKTINSITINGQYAFLACGFGIVKVNVKNAEISESYMLGFPVSAIAFMDDQTICAQTPRNGTWMAHLNDNLIDKSNWQQTTNVPSSIFAEDRTDYETHYPVVSTLLPGGPKYNYFYESKFANNQLYTTGGYFLSGYGAYDNPGIVQIYDGNDWTIYPEDLDDIIGIRYRDINCIDYDPNDANHVAVGGRCGLYEFQDGQLKAYYYQVNSPLRPATDNGRELSDNYTLVHGLKFDSKGNLWVLNSQANGINLLELTASGQWNKHTSALLSYSNNVAFEAMRNMKIDSRGLLWFVNSHWNSPAVFCYDMDNERLIRYNTIVNQDGTSYATPTIYDVTEDKEGHIWVATAQGPFVIRNNEVGQENVTFYQEKVPRNDETNYADYLLSGIHINCITIDGGGRKWMGTNGNGAFLISADNMTQLEHFTALNSNLLSDNITSISINDQTGEVFFLTDKGLCSYMSDATMASTEMTKESVYAYPNPVTPDYTGLITIVGLSYNADVKILTSSGKLVAEGRSNGGSFTWDGCDKNGKRVASGVYMVATTTYDGKKGTVCKIAIVK